MSYIGNEPIVSATRTITEVTATAGQTVFVANGGYTVGYIDVFVNGAQLQTVDFTATNGSSITLTEAAQAGDVIRLVAWGTFQSANLNGAGLLDGTVTAAKFASGQTPSFNGITFPATQSASSDANTLDDYEEGAWTPVPDPNGGSYSSYTAAGNYVKIGKTVTVTFQITISNIGTANTILNILGLPFTVGNRNCSGAVRESANTGEIWSLSPLASTTNILMFKYNNNSFIANNVTFNGSVTYISA